MAGKPSITSESRRDDTNGSYLSKRLGSLRLQHKNTPPADSAGTSLWPRPLHVWNRLKHPRPRNRRRRYPKSHSLLIALPSGVTLAKAMQTFKANSSRWIREHGINFAWQDGYAAFSVSASNRDAVRRYIERQAEHHRKTLLRGRICRLAEEIWCEFRSEICFRIGRLKADSHFPLALPGAYAPGFPIPPLRGWSTVSPTVRTLSSSFITAS